MVEQKDFHLDAPIYCKTLIYDAKVNGGMEDETSLIWKIVWTWSVAFDRSILSDFGLNMIRAKSSNRE